MQDDGEYGVSLEETLSKIAFQRGSISFRPAASLQKLQSKSMEGIMSRMVTGGGDNSIEAQQHELDQQIKCAILALLSSHSFLA